VVLTHDETDTLLGVNIASFLAFLPLPDDQAAGLGSGHWLVSCVPNQNIAPCRAGLELEIENTGRNGNAIETDRLGPKIQQGR
jgi:hypothetical protein